MSKYHPLYLFFTRLTGNSIIMTLKQIQTILGFPLPTSAWIYSAWWANETNSKTGHVQCRSWLDAGWSASPHLLNRIVTFTRQREEPIPAPQPQPVTPETRPVP